MKYLPSFSARKILTAIFKKSRISPLRRARQPLRLEILEDRVNPSGLPAVTVFTDTGAGSVRDAIIAANASSDASMTINLGVGTYLVNLSTGAGENAAASGDLDLNFTTDKTLIIQGLG